MFHLKPDPNLNLLSMNISLDRTVHEAIEVHALQIHPNECCGFLFGKDEENNQRIIQKAIPVTNSRDGSQRDRFEILPEDYMWAEKYSKDHNLSFVGIYHSHPDSPAIPSDYDHSHAFPYFSYIIVSVSKDSMEEFRSWILDDNMQFEEETVNILKK